MKTTLIALFVPILIAVLLLSCSKSTEPQTCANPVFSQTSGTYNNELFVTISCETPGAVIHYTTNGSDPTESSNQYNSGITINTTTTLKAKAFKSGWNPSTTTSANYTIIQSVATPVFSPEGGTYYPSVNVSISCSTPVATIRYTTNGSNPTSSSPVYSSPISITSTTTLKAKAFKSGWNESAIANSTYSIEMPQTVATPTFNPSGGTYNSTQPVTISCSTPGATIRYTTNGSTPTSSSPLYQNPVTISATTTLKARAFRSGWYDSEIASAVYTIDTTPTVATPTFNPPGGSYSSPQNVTISCSTSGATIRYTTNGSNPTSSSPIYTSPISVTSSTTIKAKAFKSGWNDSSVSSASFSINISVVDMVFVPGGTFIMGRTTGSGNSSELPTHQVTLSSFYISKYEVTQSEWVTVMGYNPSQFSNNLANPVERVNWYMGLVFCNKLSIYEGKTPVYSILGSTNPDDWGTYPISWNSTWNSVVCDWSANGFRLQTEAEWEYAARGATNNPDWVYSGSNSLNEVGWYDNNSGATHVVGELLPNGIGLYDMSGNVFEWCWDWADNTYYSTSPQNNPTGPSSGTKRVIRGGSWYYWADTCRVAYRGLPIDMYYPGNEIGLRLVRKG